MCISAALLEAVLDTDRKDRRRQTRQRNLAHKNNPYKTKGHSHKTGRDYSRRDKYPLSYDTDVTL